MRQLHLVGFTSDHRGLILAGRRGAKTGGYLIALDVDLFEQIDMARRHQVASGATVLEEPARTRVESALSPREMQARLRAGRTVAQVAAEAGVGLEWVERWAAPVQAEQAAAVARAAQQTLRTPRRGLSDRSLSASVTRNLAERGMRLTDEELAAAWSANHLLDNDWIIRFRYRSRGKDLQAEWLLDMATGDLSARNRLGTELGFVDPGRHAPLLREVPPVHLRVRPSAADPAPAPVSSEAETRAGSTRARRGSARPAGAGPSHAATARRAKRAATKKPRPANKTRPAKKSPAKKAVAKKSVAKKATPATKARGSVKKARPIAKKVRTAAKAVRQRGAPARKVAAAGKSTRAKATSARKATVKRAASTRASATRAPAKKAPVKNVAAKKAPTKKAVTVRTRPAKKAAAKKAVAKKAARPRAASTKRSASKPVESSRPAPARGGAARRVVEAMEAALAASATTGTVPAAAVRPAAPAPPARPTAAEPTTRVGSERTEGPRRPRPLRAEGRPERPLRPLRARPVATNGAASAARMMPNDAGAARAGT